MRIVLLGAPGTGKETQAAIIEERLSRADVADGYILQRILSVLNIRGTPARVSA